MKKIFALLLALIMICSFVACEKDTDDSNDDDSYEDEGASENKNSEDDTENKDFEDNGEDVSEDVSKSYKNDAYARFKVYLMNSTLAKLDSLGKTEENKKLVEFYACEHFYVTVSVYTWSDPESAYDLCETYYFYNSDNYLYQENAADEGVAEINSDELWIKFESTGEEDKKDHTIGWGNLTYTDVYSYFSDSSLFTIIE